MKKIALVGIGSRAVWCFGELLKNDPRAKIAAFCDPNRRRREAGARELGLENVAFYDSIEALIAAGEKIDAAVITTPDYTHADCAVAALNAGIPVLIDKPLATTVEGCRRIIEAAERNHSFALIGFNLRHHPVVKRMKKVIDSGVLGKIFLVENREFYDGGRTYMARWNRLYGKSGGLWIHKGSHDFDLFNYFLGFPKPVKVSAFAGINVLNPEGIPFELKPGVPVGPDCSHCAYAAICPDIRAENNEMWDDRASGEDGYRKDLCIYTSDKDTHDNGFALVEYANGVRASHMECFITSISDRLYTIAGDRGQLEASLTDHRVVVRPRWSKEVITYEIPAETGCHQGADPGLVDEFLRILHGEVEGGATTAQGMLATAIGQAAEISRRENRTVLLKELGI